VVPLIVGVSAIALIAAPGKPARLLARPMPPNSSPTPAIPVDSEFVVFPNSGPVERGVDYRYTLGTHCGLNEAVDFDGSLWDFAGPGAPDDGNGNPPLGFDNPFDYGTMRLVSQGVAEYRSSEGTIVVYHRRDGSKQVGMCM
jgi:hypothetical protein